MATKHLRDRIADQIEAEVRPLLDKDKRSGGYDCCGCWSPTEVLDHALRIVRGAVL